MFALHQVFFVVLAQDQIYAAIRAVSASFGDAIALLAEGFADQLLELLPAEAVDGSGRLGGVCDAIEQLLAFVAPGDRANGAEHAAGWNQVLAEQGEGAPQVPCQHAAHVTWAQHGGSAGRCGGNGMQDKPADQSKQHADPPRQAGQQKNEIVECRGSSARHPWAP